MKVRTIKRRFWWTWHHLDNRQISICRDLFGWADLFDRGGWFDWGVGRVKHQIKGKSK